MRGQHIEIDCHLVREHLQASLFTLSHVSTHNQLTDILTKFAAMQSLRDITLMLGMFDIHSPT